MSRIHGTDTQPERIVRSLLHRMGYRFRLHRRDLPGKPDIVMPKYHAVVFVHGCYWHQHEGCRKAARPKTRREFWNTKLDRNIIRDRENLRLLVDQGWSVLIVWECELKDIEALSVRLSNSFIIPNNVT